MLYALSVFVVVMSVMRKITNKTKRLKMFCVSNTIQLFLLLFIFVFFSLVRWHPLELTKHPTGFQLTNTTPDRLCASEYPFFHMNMNTARTRIIHNKRNRDLRSRQIDLNGKIHKMSRWYGTCRGVEFDCPEFG